jgi:polysaccharide export outer membrane protein
MLKLSTTIRLTVLGASLLPLLAACHHNAPYTWVQRMPRDQTPPTVTTINPGDLVDVRVFGQPDISSKGVVRPDGTLTLPLLGPVPVAGQRPEDTAQQLEERLTKFVIKPEVTVVIEQSRLHVAVIGEVRAAGVVELDSPANVLEALAKAGGMTDFADEDSIYVLRKAGQQTLRVRFTYDQLTGAEPAAINFRLKPGDVVVVE